MKQCYFCKGEIEKKMINHVHQWKGKIYYFEDLEAEVCSQCGEAFLLPDALKFMDEKVKDSSKVEKVIQVPVFSATEWAKGAHR